MTNRREKQNWARQVPWTRGRTEYEDYGWERNQSVLPEFRDPDVHIMPYEFQEMDEPRRRQMIQQVRRPTWMHSGPHTGKGPRGFRKSDTTLYEDVCERLTLHGYLDAKGITVEVDQGEVTLNGEVDSRWSKREAENVVDSVVGIQDVHNNLKVNESLQDNWIDRTGRSHVYPASGPMPKGRAEVQPMASWGQGERGARGYYDHGESELRFDDNMK